MGPQHYSGQDTHFTRQVEKHTSDSVYFQSLLETNVVHNLDVLIMFFCRWSEVTRRLELWIQILEINENGDFVPVEVVPARDVRTGGIFQLRQVGIIPNTITVDLVPAGAANKIPLSSLGSVEANPSRRALSSGLGHHASDSRNTACSVSGLCGDQKHHGKPGRR